MEKNFLCILYVSGWHISACLPRQYHFVADAKTWTEAQTYCRQTYTDLATAENTEEMKELINTLSSAGYNSDVWIGLYSEIHWRWSDGFTGSGAEYRIWDTSEYEPDFYSGIQFCVSSLNGKWWDYDCEQKHQFVCYRGTQANPEFVIVKETKSWSDAQKDCRENFTDLATVTNVPQNQQVHSLTQSNRAWIGMYRDPNIYWSDGSKYSFKKWANGMHQLGSMSILCAASNSSAEWKILACERRLPFVCHSVPKPVRKQVIKLTVQLNDSSVDLNDPVVKAELLKKLQDQLKEGGVSGVTLTWRDQLDGEVFYQDGKGKKED